MHKTDPTAWSLVDELLDLDPETLAARLAELPAERRAEVDAILDQVRCQGRAGLESPAVSLRLASEAEQIGPYLLVEELAQGGTSSVFRAVRADQFHTEPLAVKVVHFASSREKEQLFRQEIRVLARLTHPGIVRLLDGGHSKSGLFYLVMEYVDGIPLQSAWKQRTLTLRQRIELMADVCAAVAYAHARGVIHRDLKPSNILVARDGQPKLLDFGIARFKEDAGSPPAPTVVTRMTMDYASPEQLSGERPLTEATDVYSLGVILHEALLGARPGPPGQEAGGPPDRSGTRGLEPDLEAILLKALAPQKEDRYSTAAGLEQDLRAWLTGGPVSARRMSRLGYAWRRVQRQKQRAALLAAAVLFGAVTVGSWWSWNHQKRLALQRARELPALTRHPTVQSLELNLESYLSIIERAERLNGPLPELARSKLQLLCVAGELMGYPGVSSFGNLERSRAIFSQAVNTVDQAQTNGTAAAALWPYVYTSRIGLGAVLVEMGDTSGAEKALQQSWDLLNRMAAEGNAPANEIAAAKPNVLMQTSRIFVRRGQHMAALQMREQAVRLVRGSKGVFHETEIAGMLQPLAWSQRETGDLRGALATYRESESTMRAYRNSPIRGPEVLAWLARNLYEQGRILAELNRLAEARRALEESVIRLESLLEQEPASSERRRWLGLAEAHLAAVLTRAGIRDERPRRLAESARTLLREAREQAKGNVYVEEEIRGVDRLLLKVAQ